MLYENTLFSIFKNEKLFYVFLLLNVFFCFEQEKTILKNSHQTRHKFLTTAPSNLHLHLETWMYWTQYNSLFSFLQDGKRMVLDMVCSPTPLKSVNGDFRIVGWNFYFDSRQKLCPTFILTSSIEIAGLICLHLKGWLRGPVIDTVLLWFHHPIHLDAF